MPWCNEHMNTCTNNNNYVTSATSDAMRSQGCEWCVQADKNIDDVGDTQTVATELGLIACGRGPTVLCTPFTDVNLQGPTVA